MEANQVELLLQEIPEAGQLSEYSRGVVRKCTDLERFFDKIDKVFNKAMRILLHPLLLIGKEAGKEVNALFLILFT